VTNLSKTLYTNVYKNRSTFAEVMHNIILVFFSVVHSVVSYYRSDRPTDSRVAVVDVVGRCDWWPLSVCLPVCLCLCLCGCPVVHSPIDCIALPTVL